ncbi:peptidoglycan-binding protein [Actinopolymorpha sp. B17G11]|uniref:peptidoglycan-binding protein n=1 Tax=Actinopolymorpha sp. B17G11 TaxID=3160861 RepID=UPI0032E3A22D
MARRVKLQTSLGDTRNHTKQVFEELAAKYEIHFAWGNGPTGHHAAGRALDVMSYSLGGGVNNPGAIRKGWCKNVALYVWANRERLGVEYVIYDQLIQSINPSGYAYGKWTAYPGVSHANHVHISFKASPPAYKPPAKAPKLSLPASERHVPFPGASWFRSEPSNSVVTAMGKRLVAEGCGRYKSGPGPQWTDVDKASYAAWQRKLGYTGGDANGWPGEASWERLKVPNPKYTAPSKPKPDPNPAPKPEPKPDPEPEPDPVPVPGDAMGFGPLPQYYVEGDPARYVVLWTGAVWIPNPEIRNRLIAQGMLSGEQIAVSQAELDALLAGRDR